MTPLPPIKAGLDAIQIEHEGKPMVLLHDQERINSEPIAVTLPGFLVATLLDGRNTAADVQSAFSKTTGQMIKTEEIEMVVKELDRALLLETPALQEKRLRRFTPSLPSADGSTTT